MSDSSNSTGSYLTSFLRTRTGFLGLGPSYGEIIVSHVINYAIERFENRGVVREAEKILYEVNERNRTF